MIIIRKRAYARAGLIGNPSDGYNGKTISIIVRNFRAKVVLYEWDSVDIVLAKNKERIGSEVTCLVDVADISTAKGRFYGQAPEVDSTCIIQNCSASTGQFIETKVVGTRDYDLLAEQIHH